ncbi:hypothetical protein B0A49_12008 [Cryomyces minteri]|uniref:Uncharacterized protein n=1 Tax=Cryomyces minteri TaxID=331657 RepID=A0A4U0VSZ4_9PEZI|nr:hypothetical protein B0A49_12008 [Cryomyces minteri]
MPLLAVNLHVVELLVGRAALATEQRLERASKQADRWPLREEVKNKTGKVY